ncbi:MAG: hypothetical protein ACI81O_002257 [Cyclobacteriaceae bacterium]|jgi:hypothetical protein
MSKAIAEYLLNRQERYDQTEQDVVLMHKASYTMDIFRDSEQGLFFSPHQHNGLYRSWV